jgi:glycosyltransferase involved in cell wall biosynthesis
MSTNLIPDLTVIVPVRNAELFVEHCLNGVVANGPAEIIVVDGQSNDSTREIAGRFPIRLMSDDGRGVAVARLEGAGAASTPWIAFVDVDVILEPGDLSALLGEARDGGYSAVQAGLQSISGPGYWGRALVHHHRTGQSKNWFGLVATVFERDSFLRHGLDAAFLSGEDIELRWRMERSGEAIGVSSRTIVAHRFGDTFAFAMSQFLADGGGLARTAAKHGWRAAPLLALPMAAAARGVALSLLRREPQWIPYYATFAAGNWIGMTHQLVREATRRNGTS